MTDDDDEGFASMRIDILRVHGRLYLDLDTAINEFERVRVAADVRASETLIWLRNMRAIGSEHLA